MFYKGIEKADLKNIKDTLIEDHPFLNQYLSSYFRLDLDFLPKMKGEAKLLSSFLDFSLIFDQSKQPYQYKKLKNKHSSKFSDLCKI
jgi:hypothetical protein